MIINMLHRIFVLFSVSIGITDSLTTLLYPFQNDFVRGIDVYGDGFVGIALNKEVVVWQFKNGAFIHIDSLPFDQLIYADAKFDSTLLEFKLINESSVFACTVRGCSFFSRTTGTLALPIDDLNSVSATQVNNGIAYRTVYRMHVANIHYHNVKSHDYKMRSNDARGISETNTVAAFWTSDFYYFLGSANRQDLPLSLSEPNNPTRSITDVRLTRICVDDDTTNFASLIDIVLSCDGISYDPIKQTLVNRATAALFLPAQDKLLVAFQHSEHEFGTTENYICSYNFTDLKKMFSKTWKECQKLSKPLSSKDCQGQYPNLKDECYLFSWDTPNSQKQCSAYDGEKPGHAEIDNCDVHSNATKPYGSLENFKPYVGKTLFSETHTEPIVSIQQGSTDGILYALRKDHYIIQLLPGDDKTVNIISKLAAKSGRFNLGVLPNSNVLLVSDCDKECDTTTVNGTTPEKCKTTCVMQVLDSFKSSKKIPLPAKIVQIEHVGKLSIWTIVFWVFSAVCLFVAVCCYFFICITQRRAAQYMSWNNGKPRANDYQQVIPLKSMTDQLNPNKLIVLNTQPLGSGNSATVYKGSYKTTASEYEHVAVKVFNDEYAALLDTEKLIDELKVLRQIQHSNIVAFIGYTYIDRTLHIVTEYMAGGSLYDYIQNKDIALKYQHTFDHMDQILSAMVYLMQQQIVHRDLAARNCLLNKDHTVLKVSDFGLARSVDFKGEYQILHIDTALPTRWIALEAFSQFMFTEKTDVWSFGVLVWELFTRGNTPYFPLDHYQILMFLKEGRRLQCPKTCPEQIYALIITCWDSDPEKRPTFKELQKNVKDVVQQLTSANKHLTETEYERPCQPLTHFDKATAEKAFVRKLPLLL